MNMNLKTITIVCTTDEHGFIARAPKVRDYIDRTVAEKPDATLVVSCGDVYEGAAVSELERHKTALELMKPYDVVALGNHDFARGKAFVQDWANRADYKVLGANVLDEESHQRLDGVQSHTIIESGGYKIGFLGVVTLDAGSLNRKEDVAGLDFSDPIPAARQAVSELKQEGAEVVVALTHLTPQEDERFVAGVEGVDWNLGGHTHVAYAEPDLSGLHPLAKAGTARDYVVRLDLHIDPATRKLVDYDYKLIRVEDLPEAEDGPTKTMVQATVDRVNGALDQKVARLEEPLPHPRTEQNPLLSAIAGEMMEQTGAQAVLFDRGQIRRGLEAGDVTVRDMLDVAPFQTMAVTVEVPRERLEEVVRSSLERRDNSKLFIAGLDVSGDRPVASDGSELPDTVKVVTTTYISLGNAGYFRRGELSWEDAPIVRDFLEGALRRLDPESADLPSYRDVLKEADLSLRDPR